MLEKVLSAKGINYFCDIRATVANTTAKRKDYYSSAKKSFKGLFDYKN